MVPLAVDWRDALPRNANGKFDRERMRQELVERFADVELDESGSAPGLGSDGSD
jgi:acyl-coenzyme A synthetase/AMP-(fatty) acid ligase